MNASIAIVPIGGHHIEGLRACLDSVARERRYLAQVEAPPLENMVDFVEWNIRTDAAQFVATAGPVVVGWCDIFPSWAPAIQHRGTLGMAVMRDYRRRGVGTRLLTATLEKARSKGITRVELEVRSDNQAALALYRKFGFLAEGTVHHAMRLDGAYFDCIRMSLFDERYSAA